MSGRCALDTNAVIAYFANDPGAVRLVESAHVFLPCIVIGELIYGARKSGRPEENLARIDELIGSVTVLACDGETATYYGALKNDLRTIGRPIPANDLWIASLALQHDLTLISRDAHFRAISDLSVEDW